MFANLGAAYGTAKAGGTCLSCVLRLGPVRVIHSAQSLICHHHTHLFPFAFLCSGHCVHGYYAPHGGHEEHCARDYVRLLAASLGAYTWTGRRCLLSDVSIVIWPYIAVLCRAGILGIYGLIVAAILVGKIQAPAAGKNGYSAFAGFSHLAAGLACGLSSLAGE